MAQLRLAILIAFQLHKIYLKTSLKIQFWSNERNDSILSDRSESYQHYAVKSL